MLLRSNKQEIVKNKRTGETEKAFPDEKGILRDEEGRSYSDGAYEIVTHT